MSSVTDAFGHFALEYAAQIFAAAVLLLLYPWLKAKFFQFSDFYQSRRRALSAVGRVQTPNGIHEGSGVWTTTPLVKPENYRNNVRGARVLAVANLKGGVGKTTLAANVGAFFASDPEWQKRVLLIDLDYQGSLSAMAFGSDRCWIPKRDTDSIASMALSGDLMPNQLDAASKNVSLPMQHGGRLQAVTAYYDLAQADNRLLVEWLLNVQTKTKRSWPKWLRDLVTGKLYAPAEMRYNLAKLLHADVVSDHFDLVIIDCPPRLTASTIQALCASSHLIVPTILDLPSAEAVVSFCDQVEHLKSEGLCPELKHIGIVATKFQANLIATSVAKQFVEDRMRGKDYKCGFLPARAFIPQSAAFTRNPEDGIAWFSMGENQNNRSAKLSIENLSRYIAEQMGLAPLRTFDDDGGDPGERQLNLLQAAE